MADIKTVERYGGINVSDPLEYYVPVEQHAILQTMFGSTGKNGSLLLPDGSPIYIGKRKNGKSGYANDRLEGREPYDLGLFTPADVSGDNRKLIEVIPGNGKSFDYLDGFLPKAFSMILLLGRKAAQELVTGEVRGFGRIGEVTRERIDYLTEVVIFKALQEARDPDLDPEEEWMHDFSAAIDDFIEEQAARVEVSIPEDHPYAMTERPFETFIVDMSNRFHDILVHEPE